MSDRGDASRRDVLRGLAAVAVAPGVELDSATRSVPDVESYRDALAIICVGTAYYRERDEEMEIDAASGIIEEETLDQWGHVIRAAARGEEWVFDDVIDEYVVDDD